MNAIEIRGLCKAYKGFSLDHLDLTLPSGCIMGLIGENGAGKSTTMKLILDMINSDSGSITVFGEDHKKNSRLIKEDLGVVLEEAGLPTCLNAKQAGKIMKNIFKNWDEEIYNGYLKSLSIPEKKKYKEYSKGMKMKLSIAIALSHHPKLLLLDEATSGLDPVCRDEILNVFNEFTRDEGHAVLISSHIVSDLEKICDYIAFLHKGKLLLCEEKDTLKDRYALIHCTEEELHVLPYSAVVGTEKSVYGITALVLKEMLPKGMQTEPVDIEQLFIFMVKEAHF